MKYTFYYNGKKAPSKGFDIASGCLLIIALGAIIFLFSLIEDIEDFKEYWFQYFLALIVVAGLIFKYFKKKGKLFTYRVELNDHQLKMHDISTSVKLLQLNIYTNEKDDFIFYHLWDTQGNVSFYSLYNDDLCNYISEKQPDKTSRHIITDCSFNSYQNYVASANRKLNYDLESGQFTIKDKSKTIASFTPKAYTYDGKYKKDKGLSKNNK